MPELKLGQHNLFQVIKDDELHYLIKNQTATMELSKEEATQPLKVGDSVDVFLYIDHSKGISATMKQPKIDVFNADWVEVIEKKEGLGVFVDIGLAKDMLVSKDDLPHLKNAWPVIGAKLFCHLKVGRKQMIARPVSRFRMREYIKPETPLTVGESYKAYVFSLSDEGVVLFTEEGHEVFVFYKHLRKNYRMGDAVEVKISVEKDPLHYNGMLIEQKELMLEEDAMRILEYLKQEGSMPFTDKTDPQAIFDTFKMSKSAFKRGLGRLYKEGYVTLEKEKTVLNEEK